MSNVNYRRLIKNLRKVKNEKNSIQGNPFAIEDREKGKKNNVRSQTDNYKRD